MNVKEEIEKAQAELRASTQLRIENKEEVDAWFAARNGNTLFPIKGKAPEGATYADGELITRPVNVAWRDLTTGDIVQIKYKPIRRIIN